MRADMEPEIGDWSTLEYIAIATETAESPSVSRFLLSSLQPQLADNLPLSLRTLASTEKFISTTEDVEKIVGDTGKHMVCLLDPQAETALSPQDGDVFEWFVFGGILGW
jgi:ribosome biogenesis SPOUT family RNA methylase Rps3